MENEITWSLEDVRALVVEAKRKGVTQKLVARWAGLHETTISRWFSNPEKYWKPTASTCLRLEEAKRKVAMIPE